MPGPEILELVIKNQKKVVAYACSKCGLVFSLGAKPDSCSSCYRVCSMCQEPLETRGHCCMSCRSKEALKREQARYDKAEKITEAAYDGEYLFDDSSERFFESVDELLEDYYNRSLDDDPPSYAWTCDLKPFHLDAEDVLYQALEEHHEGVMDQISQLDKNRLQKYLDIWVKKQNLQSFETNYSKLVLIDEETVRKYKLNNGLLDEEPV